MDKWARAVQAAESVIEENLSHVNRITIWLIGSTFGNPTSINCNTVDADGETVKARYEIPEWVVKECDTERAMLRYVVEAITSHMIITKYDEKFD